MGSDMDWDDFRFVHTLARAGTVRQAGIMLGVHASTVVRRLDADDAHVRVYRLDDRGDARRQPAPANRQEDGARRGAELLGKRADPRIQQRRWRQRWKRK